MLDEIIHVRRSIGDPVTCGFIFAEELPEDPLPGTAYTAGDGAYRFHDGLEWKRYSLKFSDSHIGQLVKSKGKLKAAVRLVDSLMARLDPEDYINSGTAGAQAASFPSLAEAMAYYEKLRDRLLEQEAEEEGMNSGLMLEMERRPVGGVLESYG